MKISVIGTGYLGATHAAAMASLGFEVMGLDLDREKVEALGRGEVPFHEPGLAELLREQVRAGRLHTTTSYDEVCAFADVHFVCVGTPQRRDSHAADVSYVEAAFTALARGARKDALIVGKSTVPVGTAQRMAQIIESLAPAGVALEVAWNPEFLREGHAVADTLSPDRIVLGVQSPGAERTLRAVYARPAADGVPLIVTDFPTAELVKVSANALLATKVSFINAVSEVTEATGGDIATLARAIGLDDRIGPHFLQAGAGFGGGCLPKDIRAFRARAEELGVGESLQLLDQVDAVNQRARARVVARALAMLGDPVGRTITVLGAAFKPNSDDVRDSPALKVAARLHERGARVRVCDPAAAANARRRHPELECTGNLAEALRGTDLVVLMTEWAQYRELDPAVVGELVAERAVLDGRNVLDVDRWQLAGWHIEALGRHPGQADQVCPADRGPSVRTGARAMNTSRV